MAGAERIKTPSLPAWLHPDVLLAFVDDLREAEFNIGVGQYVAAQDLVLALLAQDEPLQDPNRLKTLLGPILCGSPSEQMDFGVRFDAWVARMGFEAVREGVSDTAVSLDKELSELERKSWRWVGCAVIVTGFVLFVALILFGPQIGAVVGTPSTNIDTPTVQLPTGLLVQFAVGALVVVLFVFAGWRLWWRGRARLFLERHAVTQEPQLEKVSVAGVQEDLFPNVLFFRLAQQFRHRVEVPSTRLNVQATVAATVQEGGWFTPVYGRTQIPPEYLILIDRATFGDHQAKLVDAMIAQLGRNEVFLSRYYFDGDPRLCFPEGSTRPRTLRSMMAQHSGHRLLLFTDAARFFNQRTGEMEQWTEQLEFWPERAILTPENVVQWGYTERELGRHFLVLPATVAGLTAYISTLQQEEEDAVAGISGQSSYPLLLRREPQRWLERDAPDADVLDEMVTAVRGYLGAEGFYWLSACAIYPELHWNLTLYLGQTLTDEQEQPLLTAERMASMARLPWFRYSYMPDWLRMELIMRMERAHEQQVRSVLQSLLITAVQGEMDSFQLEIAQEHGRSLNALARPLVQLLARSAPEDAPVKDYVFLSFMSGRKPKPLSVRIPEVFGRLLGSKLQRETVQHSPIRWVWINLVGAMAAALIVTLLRQYVFFDYYHDDSFNTYVLPVLQGISLGLCVGWLQARYLAHHNLIGPMRGNWFRWTLAGWIVGAVLSSLVETWRTSATLLNDVGSGMVAGALLGTVVGFAGWLGLRQRYADPARYHNALMWITASIFGFVVTGGLNGYFVLLIENVGISELLLPFLGAMGYALVVGVCTSGAFVFIRNEFGSEPFNRLRKSQLHRERFWFRWLGLTAAAYFVAYMIGQIFNGSFLTENVVWVVQGAILGGFVGVVQGRLLRPYDISRRLWFIVTLLGLSFAINITNSQGLLSSWFAQGLLVGFLIGLAQFVVLRQRVYFAGYWIMTSMISWTLANSVAEGTKLLLSSGVLGTIFGGLIIGVLYGLISSFVMQWLLANPKYAMVIQKADEPALRRLDSWINGILVQRSLEPTWQLWLKWIVVTVVAMGLGSGLGMLIASLILTLLAGDVAHVAFDDVLFWFGFSTAGLITGLVLGYAQWRYVLRPRLPRAWIWTLANGLAWAIGFGTTISTMVATSGTLNTSSANLYLFFGGYVGLALGIGQWVVLRLVYTRRYLWLLVPATAVCWVVSWLVGYIIAGVFFSSVDISFYSFAFLVVVTSIVYGATSGLILLWLEEWEWRSLPRWVQARTSPDVLPILNNNFVVMWVVLSVVGLVLGGITAVLILSPVAFLINASAALRDIVFSSPTDGYFYSILATIISFFCSFGLGWGQHFILRQYRTGWLRATTIGGTLSAFLFFSWVLLLPDLFVNVSGIVGFTILGGLVGIIMGGMQTVALRKLVHNWGYWFTMNGLLWAGYGAIVGYIVDATQRNYSFAVLAAFSLLFMVLVTALGLVMRWLLQHPIDGHADQAISMKSGHARRRIPGRLPRRTFAGAPPIPHPAFVVIWIVAGVVGVGISIGIIVIVGMVSFPDILYNSIANSDIATLILYPVYCLIASFAVGLCQWIILDKYRDGWLWASTIGGTVGSFIFWFLDTYLPIMSIMSRPAAFAIWGALVGIAMGGLQSIALRKYTYRWGYWVLTNVPLWAGAVALLGYVLSTTYSSFRAGAVLIPFVAFPTAVVLFAANGLVLRWLFQHPKINSSASAKTSTFQIRESD